MATVDVTEYFRLASDGDGDLIPSGLEPSYRNQQLTAGVVAATSQPLNENTRFVRIHTDTPIRIRIGSNAPADQTCMRMVAGQTEFLGVCTGGLTVSVIATV